MSNAKTVAIAGRPVGAGCPAYLVAEIGINHNGDMALARRTIDAAKAAGADAVKFQTYRTEDFVLDRSLTYTYESGGRSITESQFDMFKRCEVDRDALGGLSEHCRNIGIDMHATPTSEQGIADLVAVGAGVMKNGSDYLTHLPLIRAFGRTGLPTVLSTGMATLAEIDEAVRAFRETGNDGLVLLHCTSMYPTPDADLNIRRVAALAAAFDCVTGFSDHSHGIAAAIAAVTLGAAWIEKHFTFDRALPGPDHRFSSDPDEFAALVAGVRTAEAALGGGAIGPTPGEMAARRSYRLSCTALTDLPAGTVLAEAQVAFRRPGTGVRPADVSTLVGRRLNRAVGAAHVFRGEDFA